MRRWLKGTIVPLAFFAAWEFGSRAGWLPQDSTSRPTMVYRAAIEGFQDGSLLQATWQTLEAALLGFGLATVVGISLGVILGLSGRMESATRPTLDALRPIPSVALIPLSLMLFGFGLMLEATVVAFACLWPILLMTIAAVRGIEPRLLEVARTLQLSAGQQLVKIILPAAFGRIVIGLRLAVAISLVVAVTVEVVINPRGLGSTMMAAQQSMRSDVMYAQLVWLGVVGWLINALSNRAVRAWPGAVNQGLA